MIGPNVNINSINYGYTRLDIPLPDQETTSRGITIGENAWIGGGVSILDGSLIDDNAIISANSVITTTIPKNSIVQGNPAKIIFTQR